MTGVFFARQKEGNDAKWLPLIVGNREKRENHEVEGRTVKFGGGPQARLLVIGARYAGTGSTKMPRGLPTRRGLQALALVLATAYATILLYQAVAPRQWVDEMTVEVNSRSELVEVPVSRRMVISEELSVTPAIVTATMAPFTTNLDDLFISVKTTKHYHHSRLPDIISTWFQFAKDQTWFFTDRDDLYFQNQTNGHMINTKCSSSHNRRALCCKMSVEFDRFLDSGRKWFCHFDDDNYVNVPRLLKLLDNYNPREDWYLGRPSIPAPLEIIRQGPEPSKRPRRETSFFVRRGRSLPGSGILLRDGSNDAEKQRLKIEVGRFPRDPVGPFRVNGHCSVDKSPGSYLYLAPVYPAFFKPPAPLHSASPRSGRTSILAEETKTGNPLKVDRTTRSTIDNAHVIPVVGTATRDYWAIWEDWEVREGGFLEEDWVSSR
ncbi:Fringe glycosyltransferase [Eufriesea mexicana]|nr:Fringe glycosyltransferase [Eufriesea mexicana]